MLPAENTPWPPTDLAAAYQRIDSWSAWHGGDPDRLAAVYGGQVAHPYDRTEQARLVNHPTQYRGGVVGRLARWFWGEPTPLGERRMKLHIPIAGDIAATSADLLFSEPPTLRVDHAATQARLDELVDEGVHAQLLEAAEIGAALGGVYLRVCWDTDIRPDRPWLAPAHADGAVPEFRWDVLTAVTLWQYLGQDGETVYRHLERHERGAIQHAVYKGKPDNLGRRIDLGAFPQTKGLQPTVETGIDQLTVAYVPNIRPNRIWRHLPELAYWGRSDLSGVEPLMDALDETWSSLMRDIRLGKGRVIVPDVYLQNLGPGQGARFDADREVYAGLSMMPRPDGQGGSQITVQQFAIRVTEHLAAAKEMATQIAENAGYAAQTFGLAGDVAVTATEVGARERRSFVTRDKKIRYWRPALTGALQALLAIDRGVFRSSVDPDKPIDITFGDMVSEDPASLAQTAQLLRAAEAASTHTLVEMVHPDWDDDQIDAEVKAITAEKTTMVSGPDTPSDLGGPPGPPDPTG